MNFDFIIAMLIFGSGPTPPAVIQGFASMDLCKAAIVDLRKQAPVPPNIQCVVLQSNKPASRPQ